MSVSTDEMYNSESRYLHQMFRIHFAPSKILEVTTSDYLMSSSLLEEAYKHSDSPFGDVTSNEIDISLFNDSNVFNPMNTDGEYYGLIRKGIKVEAFIRPDGVTEWDPMGVFYVNDWTTTSSGGVAEVSANDILYNVLNGPVPPFKVIRNMAFKDFIEMYFAYFNLEVIVDPSITYTLPYVYTCEHGSNKEFLLDLMKSALADCFCDHEGRIHVLSKISKRAVRATLTDNDQILSIAIKQSIVTNYDSSTVSYYICQESAEAALVDLEDVAIQPGLNSTGKLTSSSHPVLSIRHIKVGSSELVKTSSFSATAKDFEASLQSTANTTANLSVIGTTLDTTQVIVGTALDTPLEVDSAFIQRVDRAELIHDYAEAYVGASMPTLELTVRGNPRISLGDKLSVDSQYYKTNYTGIVINVSYEYNGGLSCVMTLANASMIEEV